MPNVWVIRASQQQQFLQELAEAALTTAGKLEEPNKFLLLVASEFLKDFISGPDSWRPTVHDLMAIAASEFHLEARRRLKFFANINQESAILAQEFLAKLLEMGLAPVKAAYLSQAAENEPEDSPPTAA